jgi:hypothetical protein
MIGSEPTATSRARIPEQNASLPYPSDVPRQIEAKDAPAAFFGTLLAKNLLMKPYSLV